MNKHYTRHLVFILAAVFCFIIAIGTAFAEPTGGTVTQLSAVYSASTQKVEVAGSTENILEGIVVVEVLKPSGSLLYFGTAAVDEEGSFRASVKVGSLTAGTYKVRSADYCGGSYKVAEFTVPKASTPPDDDDDSGSETSGSEKGGSKTSGSDVTGTGAAEAILPKVTASDKKVTSTVNITGSTSSSGTAAINVSEANIADAVDSALAKAKKTGLAAVDIEITGNADGDVNSSEMTIPQESIRLLAANSISSLALTTPVASISFDERTLNGISETADGNVVVTAAYVDMETISEEAGQIVGDRPVFNFSVTGGSKKIIEFNGRVTVSVPYTLKPGEDPDAVVIYHINSEGELEIISNCIYNPLTGEVTFETNHFSIYAVGYNKTSFDDVPEDAWYSKAVGFIAARNITTGTGNNNYTPVGKLTRAQFIVMAMRTYGIDQDDDSEDNFDDAGNAYYKGYLSAAKRLGISVGVGNNLFAPEKEITRQEMFVLLYNTLKAIDKLPDATAGRQLSDFSDADQIDSWAKEVMESLVDNGIISGTDGRLEPKSTTTRAEMAQVLYNLLSK